MRKLLHAIFFASLAVLAVSAAVAATDAEMYFSSDKNGQNRVTDIQEGDSVWIVVYDPDENTDCDVRDKIWTDVKLMDPKTGAYIVWVSYMDDNGDGQTPQHTYDEAEYVPYKGHFPGTPGSLTHDYLEETGADTGVFVSKRAFQIGTRENYDVERQNTHVVCNTFYPGEPWLHDFSFGGFTYGCGDIEHDGRRGWWDEEATLQTRQLDWITVDNPIMPDFMIADGGSADNGYIVGWFENMDSLVGLYQDQNDESDVALALLKIDDHEATISWDQEIYKDANGAATITVVDPDENLNCSQAEYVPVFIIVNPGSWNPVRTGNIFDSPTDFCSLKRTGGVDGDDGGANMSGDNYTGMHPWTIYHSWKNSSASVFPRGAGDSRYYIEYPTQGEGNVTFFDTANEDGLTAVSFYAQETGVNTGVFQLNLNSVLVDLGFDSLNVRDVLVAYYLDPNDFDDFKLATAYIEEWNHSITSFTDADRNDQDEYWLGRDPIYVQVIDANANVDPCCPEQVVVHLCDVHESDDAEWIILDETSSNSPVFITMSGMVLDPVWDALGVGLAGDWGGFQLVLDNWKFEAYNEDDVYVRYNDVYYVEADLNALGDQSTDTAFPPEIDRIRVANDVSFDTMSIGDTQVYNGETLGMYFLDRQGNRVSGYVNSDCVFVEVIDPDQDEDQMRRERIDAFWDGGWNWPFGPADYNGNHAVCGFCENGYNEVNRLLGDTNIFSGYGSATCTGEEVAGGDSRNASDFAKLYVLNPRNGRWAAVDLMETGIDTGVFRSVICVDLVGVYECTPTLGVLPGDTILAVYQDPSNHSDVAWISVKVGIGGGGTPGTQASSTMFADETGAEVASYTDADTVYVKVVDPSHSGAAVLLDAVEIAGETYDVEPLAGATSDTFITEGLALDLVAGEDITATYTDPTDPTDTSSDTIDVVASVLDVTGFVVTPNPFDDEATFSYEGSGVAATFLVSVYNVAGDLVWTAEEEDVTEITWNAEGTAKGAYIYAITVSDGENVFDGKDVLVKK